MAELDGLIADWTARSTPTTCSAGCTAPGCPAGRIFRARDMFADPHFAAREAIVRSPHPTSASSPCRTSSPKLSDTPGAVRHAGPALGEHNDEV